MLLGPLKPTETGIGAAPKKIVNSADCENSSKTEMISEIVKVVGCTTEEAAQALHESTNGNQNLLAAFAKTVTLLTETKLQSPLEKIRSIYQGAAASNADQKNYGETRRFVLNLLAAETGCSETAQYNIDNQLNVQLEQSSNVEAALKQLAELLGASATIVNENIMQWSLLDNEEELRKHMNSCQAGFLKMRAEARKQVQEHITQQVQCSGSMALSTFTREFRGNGDFISSVHEAIQSIRLSSVDETEETHSQNQNHLSLLQSTPPPVGRQGTTAQPELSAIPEEVNDTLFNSKSKVISLLPHEEEDRTLRQRYAQALMEESIQSSNSGFSYSVQLDRPYQWEDTSADPKYPCVGYVQSAYIFWKNHCQKRRAQGAQQKYINFISFAIVKMICSTLRVVPQTDIFKWSDEELLQRLDNKFHIAQEANLLTKKFEVPPRPAKLASYELHIPHDEFHTYATSWLKELTINQERHKDLNKYDLSDVFIQSLQDCKILYDHARVLTKLSVEDLIASCSDYLQLQVLNESKTAALRKQLGSASDAGDKKGGKDKDDLTKGNGALTFKQARALLTEASKLTGGGIAGGGISKTSPTDPPFGLMAFTRLKDQTVGCEGCGKWYQNFPEKRFPNPCSGKCQYTGHPSMNKKYQEGIKWKHPGFCCSWRNIPDKDIPEATLQRLKKYQESRQKSA